GPPRPAAGSVRRGAAPPGRGGQLARDWAAAAPGAQDGPPVRPRGHLPGAPTAPASADPAHAVRSLPAPPLGRGLSHRHRALAGSPRARLPRGLLRLRRSRQALAGPHRWARRRTPPTAAEARLGPAGILAA